MGTGYVDVNTCIVLLILAVLTLVFFLLRFFHFNHIQLNMVANLVML